MYVAVSDWSWGCATEAFNRDVHADTNGHMPRLILSPVMCTLHLFGSVF